MHSNQVGGFSTTTMMRRELLLSQTSTEEETSIMRRHVTSTGKSRWMSFCKGRKERSPTATCFVDTELESSLPCLLRLLLSSTESTSSPTTLLTYSSPLDG